MTRRRQHLRTALAVAVVTSTMAVPAAAPAGAQEKSTFTVGVIQDMDAFNVTLGVTLSSFEAWNNHYPTLTDKSEDDFSVEPSLAESWTGSADGLTWTYKLREGLTWSDGEPLTAEDVVYTINRSRDEEWSNHYSTVANITAEATDELTVVLTSSEPDPKLPVMDVYIVPPQVYEGLDADALSAHKAIDDPGGGPFVMKEWKKGQFWRMEANDSYWRGRPAVDELIFRVYTNPDALIAALKSGEIDATGDIPANQFDLLKNESDITVIAGNQGGFNELSINAGDGLGDFHPAVADPIVRRAIAHAIDRQTLLDRVLNGLGSLTPAMSTSASPEWDLVLPEAEQYGFDPDTARQLLEDAGYVDTDDDGVREDPDGRPLEFRYLSRSESELSAPLADFIGEWLKDIGIEIKIEVLSDTQLTPRIAEGTYEMFVWGWVPYVDPDPMLSYFTCSEISDDPESPGWNDANWCDPEYDRLYKEQNRELDPERRHEIVQEMLKIFHDSASYVVLFKTDDLNAFRNDRFTDVVCEPTETGPFLFTNTGKTYQRIRPVEDGETGSADCGERVAAASGGDAGDTASTADDSGSSAGLVIGLVAALVVLAGIVVFVLAKRKPADERE
ncbi:MAG: ABC transporter substrate-binding protein [Acidimicrobiia bacterium]|nr:ABC transporter substrate-binding protein [Acidimicrobiia bacterium]